MKTQSFYIILLLVSFWVSAKAELLDSGKSKTEDMMVTSPNPVNNYLDVTISQELLKNDTSTKSGIGVQVLNTEGIPVFSSTKSVNQFSIFTGGLPEGEYELWCQVGKTVLKRKFTIKHAK